MSKPCLRCERDNDFFSPQKIAMLAAQIKLEPSFAANDEVLRSRLSACTHCEALRKGVLCFHCGCFVMVRARAVKNYCPHPAGDRWRKE